jgi:hypothetical protein
MELDREKIVFAIRELVDNAYKFTETGTITVTLGQDDHGVAITVADSGQGIPANELPKVFEKFYQVDLNNSGQIRGFGLGLFYVREFVKLHGGTVTLASTPGQGTRATIHIPRRPTSA